jgi:tetratricopeptide (TPR) repeat protein
VVGREFPHVLLAAAGSLPDARLAQGLDELVASGLVSRRGAPPDVTYTFKHALVQEAAYESLLRGRRAEIHAAIVAAAEHDTALAMEPGLLGHHCAQAGLIAKAVAYYRLAGQRSIERAALVETKARLEQGLHFATTLTDGPERRRLETELLVALGDIVQLTKGLADNEAGAIFQRAVPLCRNLDNPETIARALYGRFIHLLYRGQLTAAQSIASDMQSLAEARSEAWVRIHARTVMAIILFFRGEFKSARQNLEDAVVLLSREPETPEWDWRMNRMHATSPSYLAVVLACLGYPGQAEMHLGQAIDRANRFGSHSLVLVLYHAQRALIVLRDDLRLHEQVKVLLLLSEEQGNPVFLATAKCVLGWLEAKEGRTQQGLDLLDSGSTVMRDLGISMSLSIFQGLKADVLVCGGKRFEALMALDEALETSRRTGESWFSSELHRRRSELLLSGPEPDLTEVEQELQQAIRIARNQSAKLFELRSATSLARLWAGEGKRADALDLLTPVYTWFTEGFDTIDLKEARSLLDELAGHSRT